MFTPPPELRVEAIAGALAEGWNLEAASLTYAPVGFGAHHWTASGPDLFLTVHDLVAKRRADHEPTDAVFRRLTASLAAAKALEEVGLSFVLAPMRATDGQVVARIDDRFSLVVHPLVEGRPAGAAGEYGSDHDRLAVLAHVIEVHRASDVARPHALVDDLAVPHRDEIPLALDGLGRAWDTGPYGERARVLLEQHARGLRELMVVYDALRLQVAPLFDRAVLTHGEPHASNVLVVDSRFLLIDWDTALFAPAERDLWDLDPGDGSVLSAYERATGLTVSRTALDLYRLWYDLAEIGQYLGELRAPHEDTDDIAESWTNLQHFLRPAERWPDRVG